MRLGSLLVAAAVAALLSNPVAGADGARRPPSPEIEAKITDLIARMTLEEKIGQMVMRGWGDDFDEKAVAEGRVGIVSSVDVPELMVRYQALARGSRLGIPLIFARDAIHGYRTLLPVPLGLAATFDGEVIEAAGRVSGEESAAAGLHAVLGPMVDASRDPRWGRVVEGPGEDTFLARLFARRMIAGQTAGGVGSTVKHFVGYGAVRAGKDYSEADVSAPDLADRHLPPFRAGIDAGAQFVMAAFSVLNGVPVTANRRLLDDLLRREWGFDGVVVSDWDAIRELLPHGVAANRTDAAEKAVMAGIDVDMASGFYTEQLPGLVASGRVPTARIDEAVRRVLRVKFRLGLFDPPGAGRAVDSATYERVTATVAQRETAREAARRSIVLLKNEGGLLPLETPPKRIVVVGGAAEDAGDLMGAWGAMARREDTPPLLPEFERRFGAKGATITFARGCDDACTTTDGFAAAEAAARAADLVIAVLGEPWYATAESTSRTRLGLPGHQQALLDRLAATGKPIVLVTLAGRAMAMGEAMARADAVLYVFSPGTMGAPALADVLTGESNPSGRLPMSLPRAVGQIPIAYDVLPTGRPWSPGDQLASRYIDEEVTPLLPFGFGLSYTSFAYSDARVSAEKVGRGDTVRVEATVTNTGSRAGREIAQLYVRDPVASSSRPLRQLKGLARVDLAPGEAKRVAIDLPVAELAFADFDGRPVLETGRIEVGVGGSSDVRLTAAFEVVER
ncbi:MAG: glycoside hydrolase family 3 N-terminal domain-containing protein [Siculibacillus sp.]